MAPAEPIPIGKIVATFGLRGQVKVLPLTNIPERFAKGKSVLLQGNALKILSSRFFKNQWILELEGIKKIEQAELLKWELLSVPASERPELDDDEYLVDDLLDMKVVTTEGVELGKVDAVEEYPAHDVLVVGDIMIPAVAEFVELVDFDTETITVKLIEGMIESDKNEN